MGQMVGRAFDGVPVRQVYGATLLPRRLVESILETTTFSFVVHTPVESVAILVGESSLNAAPAVARMDRD